MPTASRPIEIETQNLNREQQPEISPEIDPKRTRLQRSCEPTSDLLRVRPSLVPFGLYNRSRRTACVMPLSSSGMGQFSEKMCCPKLVQEFSKLWCGRKARPFSFSSQFSARNKHLDYSTVPDSLGYDLDVGLRDTFLNTCSLYVRVLMFNRSNRVYSIGVCLNDLGHMLIFSAA
ncbi:hypothetical protein KY285_033573 [Solanum tuberosum]|nr:hypothetical protein KY285_033573 [Solanum tuberosum]